MKTTTLIITLALLAGCDGCDKAAAVLQEDLSHSNTGVARMEAMEFACTAYTQFRSEKRKARPASIDDLLAYMNKRDIKDPWGNDYVMLCGDNKPAEAKMCIGVRSHGPDGKANTPDDLVSWD